MLGFQLTHTPDLEMAERGFLGMAMQHACVLIGCF